MKQVEFIEMIINILNLVILALTLAAVIWYTIETRHMQVAVSRQVDELVRQRRLSLMPAFVASIRTRDGADYIELTNIGNGIAINVTIDPVEIRFPTLEPGSIKFEDVLMIAAGEKQLLNSTEYVSSISTRGRENKLTFLGKNAHFNTDVNLRFQDVEGGKYQQTLKMGKDGYEHGFVVPYDE